MPNIPRPFLIGGVILLALTTLLFLGTHILNKSYRNAEKAGALTERAAQTEATIKNIRKADHAEDTLRRDPASTRAECLRHARNPSDC